MNIIFDKKYAEQLKDKYIVLELDSIMQPGLKEPVVLHAVIETHDLNTLPMILLDKQNHELLIHAYKGGDWDMAQRIAEKLLGQWGGEMDQFYESVIDFCKESVILQREWDGIRHTVPKHETFE